MIVQLAGLPATGKSSIAVELARRLHGLVLDKDRVRHAFFAPHHVTYTRDQDDLCVKTMFHAAAWLLGRSPSAVVIFDGRTCSRRYQVQQVRAFARQLDQQLHLIECVCPDDVARRRLARDAIHVAANRDYGLYRALKAAADPIPEPKLVVSTDVPLASCVARCLDYLTSLDASTTLSNDPWDMAAGVVIARQAGACVIDANGEPHGPRSRTTIATAPGRRDKVLAAVRTATVSAPYNPARTVGTASPTTRAAHDPAPIGKAARTARRC